MTYIIEIEGVDGDDAMYEVTARNEHAARRIAADLWKADTHGQPMYAITTDGRRVVLM